MAGAGAAEEMREIRQLCADALRDARAVVRGNRRTTLDDEIVNAGRVLASAGIEARTSIELGDQLPDGTRHLLGLVMREATTNVLRHSDARHAVVEYRVTDGLARLRIGNDGSRPDKECDGTGLLGLTERLRAVGGELTWERDGEHFSLTATVPVEAAER